MPAIVQLTIRLLIAIFVPLLVLAGNLFKPGSLTPHEREKRKPKPK